MSPTSMLTSNSREARVFPTADYSLLDEILELALRQYGVDKVYPAALESNPVE